MSSDLSPRSSDNDSSASEEHPWPRQIPQRTSSNVDPADQSSLAGTVELNHMETSYKLQQPLTRSSVVRAIFLMLGKLPVSA
jgi:hypothetical protein